MEEDIEERKFIEGFNSGYILAGKQTNNFKKMVSEIEPFTPYLEGLKAGQDEYLREQKLRQIKTHMEEKAGRETQKDKDMGR